MTETEACSHVTDYASPVMPALVAGIHAFLSFRKQGVDGRDKPGHDCE